MGCSNRSSRVISHVFFDGVHAMQALKSLFSRVQAQPVTPAQQPVELSPESLKLVGGGLPRVSDQPTMLVDTSSATASDGGDQLPRVS
jgi:hypothetical protein